MATSGGSNGHPSRPLFLLLFAILASLGLPSSIRAANPTLPPVNGVVAAVSTLSISLTVAKTKSLEIFLITEQTKVLRDRQPVNIADIRNGEIAVVIGHHEGPQQVADTVYVKQAR